MPQSILASMSKARVLRKCAGKPPGSRTNRGGGVLYPTVGFLLLCLMPMAFVWTSMRSLLTLVFEDETYTHIPLVPIVSFYLIYTGRKLIFSKILYAWGTGSALILPGSISLALARLNIWQLSSANQNSLLMIGCVLLWAGAFGLFFGNYALRAASFPLLFLLFSIPIPQPPLSQVIFLLQEGSAKAAESIYWMFGVPFFRQGLDFALPGVTIRVAEECSGIRSSLALLILTVLASHLFLRNNWKKALLCLLVFPIAVAKNGLRIFTLSTLAVYVNPAFLHGRLHHQGGIVFFLVTLALMALLLILLHKSEKKGPAADSIE